MSQSQVTPAAIMQLATGHWASSALAAGATHAIFTHIDRGAKTPEAIAKAAGLNLRGARALLDGLTGLGLLKRANDRYENSPEAAAFLVEGKPASFTEFAKWSISDFTEVWTQLGDSVKAGGPVHEETADMPENPFWEKLVPAIAPLTAPSAQMAAEKIGFARAGAASILDVGGGSGIFSATLLRSNPKATATQLDWPNVNRVAREFVAKLGVADRFKTLDGDFHTTDFGTALHDVAVYSHIAHQESPESNIEIFRKFKKALKPAGVLVINDFVVNDDRTGPPFPLLFHLVMLQQTKEGATYRQADYRAWLTEAGFRSMEFVATPGPATLVIARP